jgi:hypothetical protein
MAVPGSSFEWDDDKDRINQETHGVPFALAQFASADPNRVILEGVTHSTQDDLRFFCLGLVDGAVMTVRFTYRRQRIRIFGAGYWRKGKKIYDEENRLHRRPD